MRPPYSFLHLFPALLMLCLFSVVGNARAEGAGTATPVPSAPATPPADTPAPASTTGAPAPAARKEEEEPSSAAQHMNLFQAAAAKLAGIKPDAKLFTENAALLKERDGLKSQLEALVKERDGLKATVKNWEDSAAKLTADLDAIAAGVTADPQTPAGKTAASAVNSRSAHVVAAELRAMTQPASQLPGGTVPANPSPPAMSAELARNTRQAAYWSARQPASRN